jgi:hypothetical protein
MHKIRNFREGHSTVEEWQGRARVAAGERHVMCESALSEQPHLFHNIESYGLITLLSIVNISGSMPIVNLRNVTKELAHNY